MRQHAQSVHRANPNSGGISGRSENYGETHEHPELLPDRLITYAELVGREKVIARTD
jgi:hypothetical protein